MPQRSAGIVLHRLRPGGIEVMLVHPGGPYWAKKDDGAWSIPKGLVDDGEDECAAALREFVEEVGNMPAGVPLPLGEYRQPGGKVVVAFALAGDFDPAKLRSNEFDMEWPPRSGRRQSFPEVDRAQWFDLAAARQKLLVGQRPMLDALVRIIGGG